MDRAAIGLGSNLGDSRETLRHAAAVIGSHAKVRLGRLSSIYLTEPVGVVDQPRFCNAAMVMETDLEPPVLLGFLLEVERQFGRDRSREVRWGPRTLDLDLLLFGDRQIEIPGLVVPHPRLLERGFVLLPLAELAGEWLVPGAGRTVEEAARAFRQPSAE